MANYNKVMLMGNLTRDIEVRFTTGNQPVANFGLATNRKYRPKDSQELREETTFVDCEAWGRTAEVMKQYLSKGRPVFVEGRLKLDTWQDKEGNNRSKLKVVVESFEFIDSRPGGGGGYSGSSQSGSSQAGSSQAGSSQAGSSEPAPAHAGGGSHQPIPEDDIPF